ncbi:MAG: hypothetical protein WCT04_03910 [Planctomycetota bacterium]
MADCDREKGERRTAFFNRELTRIYAKTATAGIEYWIVRIGATV